MTDATVDRQPSGPHAPSGRPTGYWIALPDGWITLDLGKDASQLREGLALAASLAPGLNVHLPQLERMLATVASDVQRSGIGFTAILSKPLDEGFVLQATLSIAGHQLGAELGARNDVDAVRRALLDRAPGFELSTAELPAGTAVRQTGVGAHMLPGTETEVQMLSDQWFLPIPGTRDGLVQIAFGSPTLPLTDELLRLFAAMTESFRFTWDAVPGQRSKGATR